MPDIIEIKDDLEWNDLILGKELSNIFHTVNWENLLRKTYSYNIKRYALQCDKNTPLAGLQLCILKKKIMALPFVDYYNYLYKDKESFSLLIKFVLNEFGEKNAIVLKNYIESTDFKKHSDSVLHIGKYESIEYFEKILSESYKRGVRKAIKSGLELKIDNSRDSLQIYYNLHLKTRKKQGVPIQPKLFFDNLYSEIIAKGLGLVSIVYKNSIPISGGIFLYFNKTFTYKFGASDIRYLDLRPNNLLFYNMINYSIEKGFPFFDFGKTDKCNTGLRKFKSGWGAQEKDLYYSYYPEFKESKFKNYIKDNLMKNVIRHSPVFVCRLFGETFYKYSN